MIRLTSKSSCEVWVNSGHITYIYDGKYPGDGSRVHFISQEYVDVKESASDIQEKMAKEAAEHDRGVFGITNRRRNR